MNYYPFHIGDYVSHTRHLTLMEDLAYRRMLDLYYRQETPLFGDKEEIARKIGMRDEVDEVGLVLAEFFAEDEDEGDMWSNRRADTEIAAYQKKRADASRAGHTSAERRFNGRSTDVQRQSNGRSTNQNQEPVTKNQNHQSTEAPASPPRRSAPAVEVEKPDGVDEQVWQDWLRHRKAVKSPVTTTVLKVLATEAGKAGLTVAEAMGMTVSMGWRGFRAAYVTERNGRSAAPQPTRNLPNPTKPLLVFHEPGNPACECEKCYIARRGHNETIAAKQPQTKEEAK